MAGKLFVDTIDTDNAFITLNVQQSLIATMNVSGIFSNTGVKMIGANGTVSNTAITGLITAAQIATVANTQITGNITSSQITSVANTQITGDPLFSAGSNTAPSITTSGDTDTGIYFPSANTIAFTRGGIEVGRFDSTANANFQFNSGYGSSATAYGCRAWVNFNGTGTVAIRASGNVSSITDNGTGNYTVNMPTAMVDVNYVVVATAQGVAASHAALVCENHDTNKTTSAVALITSNRATATAADAVTVNVAIFR